ncbi:conserved hypothetical protein [Ricinus communis]|uniref:Uncharacterized protein n=1 Tax=Ricinus communis TaxID=3988 RepID=B9S467_RICCO|nr:conserved hypothetical protein [Ricinus communis]
MMRKLAAQFNTYLSRTKSPHLNQSRNFSSSKTTTKGDNLVQQSVSLLQVKDPFFKRTGASRLARFAISDEKRMKVVELGGAQELVHMLEDAKDENTRIAALKALAALSYSDEAVGALHNAGAISVIKSTPDSPEEAEIKNYKSSLLKRFQELRYDS